MRSCAVGREFFFAQNHQQVSSPSGFAGIVGLNGMLPSGLNSGGNRFKGGTLPGVTERQRNQANARPPDRTMMTMMRTMGMVTIQATIMMSLKSVYANY